LIAGQKTVESRNGGPNYGAGAPRSDNTDAFSGVASGSKFVKSVFMLPHLTLI
jgi:hypothetical protein